MSLAGKKLSEAKDYTARDVVDTLGVAPSQVVDYKALVGDSSDNIPGVPGVGCKDSHRLCCRNMKPWTISMTTWMI